MERNIVIFSILLIWCLSLSLIVFAMNIIANSSDTHRQKLLEELKEAKKKLEKQMDYLRSHGIPIKSVKINETIMALVVSFDDMKVQYVEPIRNIIGYHVPVIFYELKGKKLFIGKPPASRSKLVEAYHKLALTGIADNIGISSMRIDSIRGLLYIRVYELTNNTISMIRKIIGYEIPVIIEEVPWAPKGLRLYIGKPSSKPLSVLEEIKEKLVKEWPKLREKGIPLTLIDVCDFKEGARWACGGTLYLSLEELKYEYIKALRDIVGYDTPLVIVKAKPIKELQDKNDKYRPLLGGTRVETIVDNEVWASTLGFGAIDNNSIVGIVISGHVASGRTGIDVYQNTTASSNYVGEVTRSPSGPRWSDVAWVPTNDASPYIYVVTPTGFVKGPIKGTSTVEVDYSIHMQSIRTYEAYGHVDQVGVDLLSPTYGTLYD